VRVGVVDIGTNSTRLYVADVEDGRVAAELERRSIVTRLGEGVDTTGRLGEEPMGRVFAVLDQYRSALDELGVEGTTAVLTSAVRDAENGAEFSRAVRDRYRLEARTIPGEEEARLTYLGATSERPASGTGPVVVIDIGGGSTEVVIGEGEELRFHHSMQVGVVRFTERYLHTDPPHPDELTQLAAEVRAVVDIEVPLEFRRTTETAIAVAGTATSLAAIDLELDPYDPDRVNGHRLPLGECELLLARLAALPLEKRRHVVGLDPDRAPTIVAGVVILVETLRAFEIDEVEVSEHDILYGGALRLAGVA
jgi:exopolyphosphatase/guanosine-5'-triphosphate,3'-diphosphate pyrophosphatase